MNRAGQAQPAYPHSLIRLITGQLHFVEILPRFFFFSRPKEIWFFWQEKLLVFSYSQKRNALGSYWKCLSKSILMSTLCTYNIHFLAEKKKKCFDICNYVLRIAKALIRLQQCRLLWAFTVSIFISCNMSIALDKTLFSTKKYLYFSISWRKHMLWVLIRSASLRRF